MFGRFLDCLLSIYYTVVIHLDTTIWGDTVDGKNPAPVDVDSLSHYLQGFSTIPGGAGFLPSTVLLEAFSNIKQANPSIEFVSAVSGFGVDSIIREIEDARLHQLLKYDNTYLEDDPK